MNFLLSELDIVFANELPALDRFNVRRPDELLRYSRHVVDLISHFIRPHRVTAIRFRRSHEAALSALSLPLLWEELARRAPDSVDREGAFGFHDRTGGWENDAEIAVAFSWFLVGRADDLSFRDNEISSQRFFLTAARSGKNHYRLTLDDGSEMEIPGSAPAGVHLFRLESMREGIYAFGQGSRRRDIICESTGLLNRPVPGFDNLWLSTAPASRLFPRVERWLLPPLESFGYVLPGKRTLSVVFRTGTFCQPEEEQDFFRTDRSRLSARLSYAKGREREAALVLRSRPGVHQNEKLVRKLVLDIPAPRENGIGSVRLDIRFENPNGDQGLRREKILVANPSAAPVVSWRGAASEDGLENRVVLDGCDVPLMKKIGARTRPVRFGDISEEERSRPGEQVLCTPEGPRAIAPPRFAGLTVPSAGGWPPGIVEPAAVPGSRVPAREDPETDLTEPVLFHYVHEGVRHTVAQRFLYRDLEPDSIHDGAK